MCPARNISLCVSACALLFACDKAPPKPVRERPPAEARIEKTIELPGGQGTVHVLAVPTGLMEAARCVVVTSTHGSPAVSCAPKDLDLAAARE